MKNDPTNLPCPKCGEPIPADAPRGLCPRCMIAGVATPTDAGLRGNHRIQPPLIETVVAAFPDLEAIELIGVGGMGVVYKARQPKLDRWVALKLLPPSLGADPSFAERFNREARFLARLAHPNIVTVFDFGQAGGFCYLLMEYVDGVNLRQAMRTGRFSPSEALAIVPRVCEALQYAHEKGVLHRDIKPENILLDGAGRVKIADFGVAKMVGEDPADITLTLSGARLGTPHYMAPEQIEKPGQVDHRADIYSLGVVFYELLTGELPLGRFPAPSSKATIDARVDEIVMRALAKERELRQQTAGEVGTQVEHLATPAGASSARDARKAGDGKWAGIRVVREESGKSVVHGPGVLLAWLAFLPAATLVFVFLIFSNAWARHPFERAAWASAGFLVVVAALAVRGAMRARDRHVPGACGQPTELPRWARVVAWGFAAISLLGVASSLVDHGAHSSDFAVKRISIPFPFLFVSIALWTRDRRWRGWATGLLGTALLSSMLAGFAGAGNGLRIVGPTPGWRMVTDALQSLMLPAGILALWHRDVRRAFGAETRGTGEAAAPPAAWKRLAGRVLVSLGTMGITAAFLYATLRTPEFRSHAILAVETAESAASGARASDFPNSGTARRHPNCQAWSEAVPNTGLWEITAQGNRADEVAACANEFAAELVAASRGGIMIIDRAVPPPRPVRPNGPLAFASGTFALVSMVLPGVWLLRSGRRDSLFTTTPGTRIPWWVKGAFVASILGILAGLILRPRYPSGSRDPGTPLFAPSVQVGESSEVRIEQPAGQSAWLSLTLWSNGVARPLRSMDSHLPSMPRPSTLLLRWHLARGTNEGEWTIRDDANVTATIRLPTDITVVSTPLDDVRVGNGERARRWLWTASNDLQTPRWGVSLDIESSDGLGAMESRPLVETVGALASHRIPAARDDLRAAIEATRIHPEGRCTFRFSRHFYEFDGQLDRRLTAMQAVLAALANDPGGLREAIDAGASKWSGLDGVELFSIGVNHFVEDSPEVTASVRISSSELARLEAGRPPEITVIRQPKAFGQPVVTNVLTDNWWLVP